MFIGTSPASRNGPRRHRHAQYTSQRACPCSFHKTRSEFQKPAAEYSTARVHVQAPLSGLSTIQGRAVGLTTHRSLIFSHTERGICLPSPPNIQGALKPAPGIARTSFDKFGVPPCYREQRSVPRTVERSKAHRCSTETHARTHSSHQTQFPVRFRSGYT